MQLTGLFVLVSAALGTVAQNGDAVYEDVPDYNTEKHLLVSSFILPRNSISLTQRRLLSTRSQTEEEQGKTFGGNMANV